ncbi:hypothetical protein P4646_25445 [Peribacillus simplex]|uniref:hypothetical protein n=1 Tax=Peribacillus simplex TaxID=1478 RepID=UPI0011A77440|nr:hypothetical protein [Peribacillus simplex]MED3987345.1 hypothetical protein [Peribacillus simplex]MED4094133.1 hypothetical protein [Peribacillus simplex]
MNIKGVQSPNSEVKVDHERSNIVPQRSNTVRERPNIVWFRSINCVNGPRQCSWSNKVLRLLWFFTVILIGLKKFATLLPNYWLAETPQALAPRRLGRQSAERERISEII